MEKIVGIYKITSPSNKIYIGQSKNIYSRWIRSYNRMDCKKQPHLYNSLLKYGANNHKFEILETCELEELNEKEIYYINLFNSTNKETGLNHRLGGNGKIVCESTIEKMRKNAMGNKNMLGKKHSEATKAKISKNRKNKLHSEFTKKVMSEKRKGTKLSEETKKKISECNKFTRSIIEISTQQIFSSIRYASNILKISESTIYRGLKTGKYGYI